MKFIDLEQRTEAWKDWRRQGLTATDSPVILGANPYKTRWRLWAEKTGKVMPPDLSKNPNVRYGVAHEDDARRLFEMRHAVCALPACGEWDDDPLFRASFDGLTPESEPVEIKCPSAATLEDVRTRGLGSEAVRMYAVQLQHQMLVAGAARGWLVFYDGSADDLIEFEIERDDALINHRIIPEGRAFFELVRSGKEPDKDPMRDVYVPQNEADRSDWISAAKTFLCAEEEIRRLRREIERFQAVQEPCKDTFRRLMGNSCCAEYAGIAVTRSRTKGRINAEKLFEAALSRKPTEAELAVCRSPDAERWLFRVSGRDLPEDSAESISARERAALSGDAMPSFYF